MKTALVIEDNEDNRVLITKLLENADYRVIWADLGLKGVEMARDAKPDFVILDIQLPDIMGTEVLRRLRNDSATVALPIIAMTSYAMAGDRENLLSSGCNGYIEKPFDPDRVIEQIRTIIEHT